MLQNAYFLAKISADSGYSRKRATFCRNFAKNWQLPYGSGRTRAGGAALLAPGPGGGLARADLGCLIAWQGQARVLCNLGDQAVGPSEKLARLALAGLGCWASEISLAWAVHCF